MGLGGGDRVTSQTVRVDIPGAPYDVVIGAGVLQDAAKTLALSLGQRRIALVTDTTVGEIHGARVSATLASAGFEVRALSIAPGEGSKNWLVAGQLLEALAHEGLERDDLVVAFGGGVVGDLSGFVAATYLRGIAFVQIPTTLLADVDSSVGGKTGVDLTAGKNLAGAFKQPTMVIVDTEFLSTLPKAEWSAGLAEIAKSAVISGEEFLCWLEGSVDAIDARDPQVQIEAIRRSVEFKAAVVGTDEKESGIRECLNYGHTLGHAIENVAGYGVVSHGAAVAEGMRFAVRIAVEVLGASQEFVKRQDVLLDSLGLGALNLQLDPEALLAAMRKDKKVRSGEIRWVLPSAAGQWSCVAVDDRIVMEHLRAWADSKSRESR